MNRMQVVSREVQFALEPHALSLVEAMMRTCSIAELYSGDLLLPHGALKQDVGGEYFLEGNLHGMTDVGPWHEAKVHFRLNISSAGTVLERRTLINAFFEYCMCSRRVSNFRATEIKEQELLDLLVANPDLHWDYRQQQNDLRY